MATKTLSPNNTRRLSRETWAWLLIISNAVSMAMMYAMQGYLVSGESLDALPNWFWPADVAGWMIRSVVESLVVFYLFRTEARSNWDKAMLAFFEISLILLIMLTQGPALYALSIQSPIAETLSSGWLRLWTVGLGTYGALMLAAAGVAYRIQPTDVETIELSTYNQALADATAAHDKATALKESLHTDTLDAANGRARDAKAQLTDLQTELDQHNTQLASQQTVVTETQTELANAERWIAHVKSAKFTNAKELARWVGFVSAGGKMPAPGPLAKKTLGVTAANIRESLREGEALGLEWANDDQIEGA